LYSTIRLESTQLLNSEDMVPKSCFSCFGGIGPKLHLSSPEQEEGLFVLD
ncbi:hypothetical protein BAE44_0007204, partial [Dichanthelium oligosanthes]